MKLKLQSRLDTGYTVYKVIARNGKQRGRLYRHHRDEEWVAELYGDDVFGGKMVFETDTIDEARPLIASIIE